MVCGGISVTELAAGGDGSTSDAHLEVDAAAAALVAVGATRRPTDGCTAAGAPARDLGRPSNRQHHRQHQQQPCVTEKQTQNQ